MSIDRDLEAYDELCDELAYVGSRKFDQGLVADAIVALIDAKLDARLSPAPVGGETEEEERFKALVDAYRKDPTGSWAPTPPPAEPDGGDGLGDTATLRHNIEAAAKMGHTSIPVSVFTARKIVDRIAGLEHRLAKPDGGDGLQLKTTAEERSDVVSHLQTRDQDSFGYRAARDIDTLTATLAERDRRIAELESGLKPFSATASLHFTSPDGTLVMVDVSDCFRARALLSPATDKGGE